MLISTQTTKVAVCSRSFSNNKLLREELLKTFPNTKFNDKGVSLSGQELIAFLGGVERAIIALEYLTEDIICQLPDLKVVGKYGVGLDKLDLAAMSRAGIQLGWTPGVNAAAVAELTIAIALGIVRKIPEAQKVVNQAKWTQVKGRQLSSLRVGVIGYGNVGSRVGRLFKAFDSEVYAYDIKGLQSEMERDAVTPESLNKLIATCDLITIHVPYNASNHHLIGRDFINRMKKGVFLINTARGGLIDETALLEYLVSGHVKAAGFDVFEIEPPVHNPLVELENVIVTPHIGGSSEEAIIAMGRAAIHGLSNYCDAMDYQGIG